MSTGAPDSDPDWPRLAELFARCSELDAEPLQAQLQAIAADPRQSPLLPRLRALLAAHALDAGPLEHPPMAPPAAAQAAAGDRVGPWTLLRPLGEGGMGTVWLAQRTLGSVLQQVALKRMHGGLPAELHGRFMREQRILARLAHPHIAAFVDAGVDADDVPWLALEFVEGERLGEACQRQRLEPPARVRLLLQVLDALDHAHRQLVVHRDLKPGNVMVDRQGRVKLLDFGIAKLLDEVEPGDALTRTRLPAPLTPRYAAPEQLIGATVGTGADLYAVGVLLYELLTGRCPFEDGTPPGARAQPESLWRAHQRAVGSGRAPAPRLRRMLRGELQLIVRRALALDPAERYASAAAFAADLRAWLEGRPLLSRATPWPRRLAKWARRQPLASTSLAVAVLALAGGVGTSLWQARAAAERAQQAEAARRFLGEVFASADPQLHAGEPPSLAELLARGGERLRHEPGLDPRARVLLLQDLGRASLGLDLTAQAAEHFEEAARLAPAAALDAAERQALQLDRARLALALDDPDQAEQLLSQHALPSPSRPPDGVALQRLDLQVQVALARSRPDEGLGLLSGYLAAPAWQADPAQGGLQALQARLLMQSGRPREALETSTRALGLLGDAAPLGQRLALSETEVEALRNLLETPRALQRQREVIALAESRLGPGHARSQWARMMLCGLLIGAGRLGEADAEYGALWQQLAAAPGREGLRAEALFGWGMVALRRGEVALARARFGEAAQLYGQRHGVDSHRTRSAREAEAMARVELGEVGEGLAELEAQVAHSRALGDAARLVSQLNSLAVARLAAGRAAPALEAIEESLALAAGLGQATVWTRVLQGRALREAGRVDASVATLEQVVAEYREQISPQGGPRRAEAERELALSLQRIDAPPRARIEALMASVLAQRRASLGTDSPLSRASAAELAALQDATGRETPVR